MTQVLNCESTLNPNAVGDNGKSFGIAQIHLPSHPEITKEQALDPAFAIEYLAKEISEGNGGQWSCWRIVQARLH